MLRKAGWVSIAVFVAACSGGSAMDTASTTPPTTPESNSAPKITTRAVRAQVGESISMTIAATDANGDSISFTKISGPDWLTLSSTGSLTGSTNQDTIGTHDLVIQVSDGTDAGEATINVTVFLDPVEQALMSGDFTYITEYSDTEVPTVLRDEIAAIRTRNKAAIRDIFELNSDGTEADDSIVGITWRPSTRLMSIFHPEFPYSFPILTTNTGGPARHLGILGEIEQARYAAFGSQPFPNAYADTNLRSRMMKNVIDWLVQTDGDGPLKIVLAHISEEHEELTMRDWLSDAYGDTVSLNEMGECEGAEFATCVAQDTDLMIVFQDIANDSQRETVRSAINAAMKERTALIFVKKYSENTGLGSDIIAMLRGARSSGTDQFFISIEDYSPAESVYGWEPELVDQIVTMTTGIQDETLDYDLSVCADAYTCEQNEAFNAEIASGLQNLRDHVREFEGRNRDPFATYAENRFFAALLLTGDYFRSLTTYPMPKASTPSTEIIRALFGDLSVMTNRSTHPLMSDLGVFSRTDFEHVEPGDAQISLQGGPIRSTGLYALPGETFTVTRDDIVQVDIGIQVNELNPSSGHPFKTIDGTEYRRPVFVNSTPKRLRRTITVTGNNNSADLNDTVEVTSIHGGPIFVYMNSPNHEVELSFTNVAQHPLWRSSVDNEAFLTDLAADDFDWAELNTSYLDLRSTVPELNDALDVHGTPSALAEAMETYLHSWPFWLHGAHGDGILDNPDLNAFIEAHGITETTAIDTSKRWNAGNATCADGCGVDTFEFLGIPDPTSYASQLLRGKTLANMSLTLSRGPEQAIADLYAIHGKYRQYQATNETDSDCHPLPHEELYALIQAGYASGSPHTTITDEDMSRADFQNAMFVQLMAALEAQGVLEDGWTYLPRVNLVTRIMNENLDSIIGWNSVRDSIGFTGWPRSSATAYSTERDRSYVAMSWAAQRSLVPFLRMWGYQIDSNERIHINRIGLEPLEPVFYAIPETGHCSGLDYQELPVDGVTAWPQ